MPSPEMTISHRFSWRSNANSLIAPTLVTMYATIRLRTPIVPG